MKVPLRYSGSLWQRPETATLRQRSWGARLWMSGRGIVFMECGLLNSVIWAASMLDGRVSVVVAMGGECGLSVLTALGPAAAP